MKIISNHKYAYALFITISNAIILGFTFVVTSYVCNEGFNPSDDGVILAQSYRIINGETAHEDFISIRPVFSGVLHTINFLSPLPLVISGRYTALIEYYIYSVLWVLLLLMFFLEGTRKDYFHIFLPLSIATFLLNLNSTHLYPWSTIDGILFTMTGLFFYFKAIRKTNNRKYLYYILALFCVSLGALAKQNFIFTALFIFILVIIDLVKADKIKALVLVIILGITPFITYFIYLLMNDSLPDFITQMSGRTEFFHTAVLRFGYSFVTSKLIIINGLSLCILLLDYYARTTKHVSPRSWRTVITFNNTRFFNTIILIYLLITIVLSFWFIMSNNYHSLPFEFFNILIVLFLISLYKGCFDKKQLLLFLSGIVISWSASISLGANSPVYTSGILVSGIVIIIYTFLKKASILPLANRYRIFLYFSILVMMHGFFFAAIYGQSKYNYRELSSEELDKNLFEVIPEFGNIKTNPNTFSYYSDFIDIYNSLNLKDRFALLPNNAIIYPLLDSKNPLAVDWAQAWEFSGSEDKLTEMLINTIDSREIYFLIDRYDSKEMAFGFQLKKYDKTIYPYMHIIYERCTKVPFKSEYFDIYKSDSAAIKNTINITE